MGFNSLTPHFLCDNLNIKKTLLTFVLILINSGFETKSMISFALLHGQLYYIQVIFWSWFCQVLGNSAHVDDIDAQHAAIDGHVNIDLIGHFFLDM